MMSRPDLVLMHCFSLWHRVRSTVGGRYRNRVLLLGLLDGPQHLVLVLQVQPVAALGLHEGGPAAEHAPQSLREGAVEVLETRPAHAVHGEVDAPTCGMDVHVGRSCKLYTRGGGEDKVCSLIVGARASLYEDCGFRAWSQAGLI